MAIIEYTPTWVVMTDAWSVVGPFESEADAVAFASRLGDGADAVAMIPAADYERGMREPDEKKHDTLRSEG